MAEAQIAILKVIVAAQFFSSCYFKVQLLHNVTFSLMNYIFLFGNLNSNNAQVFD